MRHRLSKIGFRFDGEALSDFKAQAFTIISGEMDACQSEDLKKASRRR